MISPIKSDTNIAQKNRNYLINTPSGENIYKRKTKNNTKNN